MLTYRGLFNQISCQYHDVIIQCTEMRFGSFLSGGFITAIVVNPPEKKLAKRRMISYPDIIISPNPEVKDSVIPRA